MPPTANLAVGGIPKLKGIPMDQHPGVLILALIAAAIGGGYLFVQIAGACITLLGLGLGCAPKFAVVLGTLIAVGLTIHALTSRSTK